MIGAVLSQVAGLARRSWYGPLAVSAATFVILILPLLTGYVKPAIGVDARQIDDVWVITQVDREGPARSAGVQVGDVVVAVDGARPTAGRLTDPGLNFENASSLTVLRGGQERVLYITRGSGSWVTLAQPIGLFVVALIFWALATSIRLLKPKDPLVGRFFLMNLAIAAVLSSDGPARVDALWADILEIVALSLVPSLSLSFLVWFVTGSPPAPRLRRIFNGLAAAGVVVGIVYVVLGYTNSDWFDTAQAILFTLLAAFCLGSVAWLIRILVTARSPALRVQVRILLIGISVAVLPISVLCLIPAGLGAPRLVEPGVAAVSTAFLPLCFGYSIFRHKLLGVDVVVGRTLVYGGMTLLLAGCYALFLAAVDLMTPSQRLGSDVALVFFAIVTLSFTPVQNWLRFQIDRLIYRDRYDYAEILRVTGAKLASVAPVEDLLVSLSESLASAMNLTGVAVIVREPRGELVVRGACGDYCDQSVSPALLAQLSGHGSATSGAVIRLVANGEESGAIILGLKKSRAEFTEKDLTLAETVASQAAVALANSLLVERLQAKVNELELLRDQLLQVRDAERKRLAQDLHDGALHTVLALVRQAESAAEHITSRSSDSITLQQRLHDLAERGQDAAYELRSICTDLYPSELSHLGLVAALESLARGTSLNENLVVSFLQSGFPDDRRLSEAVEETLYRVAREAVANISRHAEAERAWIRLTAADDEVVLSIRDDGRGFVVPPALTALLRTGHIGLASMRERVAQLGGELVIVSHPGAGTEVSARIGPSTGRPDVAPSRPSSPQEAA